MKQLPAGNPAPSRWSLVALSGALLRRSQPGRWSWCPGTAVSHRRGKGRTRRC